MGRTALVALVAKDQISGSVYQAIVQSLVGYGLGAFASAMMMFCIMQTADWWNYFWYMSLFPAEEDVTDYEAIANRWHNAFYVLFVLSMGCFLLTSSWLAISLLPGKQALVPG